MSLGNEGTVPKTLPGWAQLRMVLASAVASLSWESGLALAGLAPVLGSHELSQSVPVAGAGAGGRAGCRAEEVGRGPEGRSQVRAQDQGAELPGTAALDTAPAPVQQPLAQFSLLGLTLPKNPSTKPSPAWASSGLCVGNDNCTSFFLSQHPLPALWVFLPISLHLLSWVMGHKRGNRGWML